MFIRRADTKPEVRKGDIDGWYVTWWFGEAGVWQRVPFGNGEENWKLAIKEACLIAHLQGRSCRRKVEEGISMSYGSES